MNIQRNLFVVLTMVMPICFTSCIFEGGNSSKSSFGGHEQSTSERNVIGEWVEYDGSDPYAEDYLTMHYIFNTGGNGYWKLMGDLNNPRVERGRGRFNWSQSGNSITITNADGDVYVMAIHGNELVKTGGLMGVETYRRK